VGLVAAVAAVGGSTTPPLSAVRQPCRHYRAWHPAPAAPHAAQQSRWVAAEATSASDKDGRRRAVAQRDSGGLNVPGTRVCPVASAEAQDLDGPPVADAHRRWCRRWCQQSPQRGVPSHRRAVRGWGKHPAAKAETALHWCNSGTRTCRPGTHNRDGSCRRLAHVAWAHTVCCLSMFTWAGAA